MVVVVGHGVSATGPPLLSNYPVMEYWKLTKTINTAGRWGLRVAPLIVGFML